MEISRFTEKLNRIQGQVYVIEEEVLLQEGVYEAQLQHDNVKEATLAVYTGPRLTGRKVETYSLSTPSLAPWKRMIRIHDNSPRVYISYETDGDTVEADDINLIQEAVRETDKRIQEEISRSQTADSALQDEISTGKPNWDYAYKHTGDKGNPHNITKADIGLYNVENKSGSEIRSELTKEEVAAALGYVPAESVPNAPAWNQLMGV